MSNKPFYAKFLKSGIRPEEGCSMYSPVTRLIFDALENIKNEGAMETPRYKGTYRVDMYICARDRQLPCPLYYDTINKEFYTHDELERTYGVTTAMNHDESIIPVLGLLSPVATKWIAQGTEFDYGEVEPNLRWYVRGTVSKWLRMTKVYENAVDKTHFAQEKQGQAVRAISVKSEEVETFY